MYHRESVRYEYLGVGNLTTSSFGSLSPKTYRQYTITDLAARRANKTYDIFVSFDNADIGDTLHLSVYDLKVTLVKNVNNSYIRYKEQSSSDAKNLFQLFNKFVGSTIPITLSQ